MASLRRRGKTYYAQYYVGSKQRRICLQTESHQIAREKLRKLESSIAQGDENPLPSRTPIASREEVAPLVSRTEQVVGQTPVRNVATGDQNVQVR